MTEGEDQAAEENREALILNGFEPVVERPFHFPIDRMLSNGVQRDLIWSALGVMRTPHPITDRRHDARFPRFPFRPERSAAEEPAGPSPGSPARALHGAAANAGDR